MQTGLDRPSKTLRDGFLVPAWAIATPLLPQQFRLTATTLLCQGSIPAKLELVRPIGVHRQILNACPPLQLDPQSDFPEFCFLVHGPQKLATHLQDCHGSSPDSCRCRKRMLKPHDTSSCIRLHVMSSAAKHAMNESKCMQRAGMEVPFRHCHPFRGRGMAAGFVKKGSQTLPGRRWACQPRPPPALI